MLNQVIEAEKKFDFPSNTMRSTTTRDTIPNDSSNYKIRKKEEKKNVFSRN